MDENKEEVVEETTEETIEKTDEVSEAAEVFAMQSDGDSLKKEKKEKKERSHPIHKVKAKIDGIDSDVKDKVRFVARVVAVCILAVALIAACCVSAYRKVQEKHAGTGVMISISEVSEGMDPFYGVRFADTPYTYDQMLYRDFGFVEEAREDKADQLIAELLASRDESDYDYDYSVPEVEYGEDDEAPEIVDIDAQIQLAEEKRTTEAQYIIVYAGPLGSTTTTTNYTYADETGTYEDLGEFVLTAYCPCAICCGVYSNPENPMTASGNPAVEGVTIATDTSVIPFGTKIKIGDHIYTAQDRGGAIKGNRIDVYFNDHDTANSFGRQVMHVYKVIE